MDLQLDQYKPLSKLFQSLRPDIAILSLKGIDTLELTVCHETNLAKSKQYKSSKYTHIQSDTVHDYSNLKIENFTIEVTTLGFISDVSKFCKNNLLNSFPAEIFNQITVSAISNSFEIYCNRNSAK